MTVQVQPSIGPPDPAHPSTWQPKSAAVTAGAPWQVSNLTE